MNALLSFTPVAKYMSYQIAIANAKDEPSPEKNVGGWTPSGCCSFLEVTAHSDIHSFKTRAPGEINAYWRDTYR
jgi:hypothetical protein